MSWQKVPLVRISHATLRRQQGFTYRLVERSREQGPPDIRPLWQIDWGTQTFVKHMVVQTLLALSRIGAESPAAGNIFKRNAVSVSTTHSSTAMETNATSSGIRHTLFLSGCSASGLPGS